MPADGGRILVVDDNRINRMMLERALLQRGYAVVTAENGRQALEKLGTGPFDVVLLDILMPEVDGYQVLEQIKASPSLRHIPVIMISALDEMDSVVRCIEMGATDYLPKPFNPALLQARLHASLAEKRLRDLEREYLEQVGYVAGAAAAVEGATFDPASLDLVAAREDALGQLARVFQRMAREVHLREQRLKRQLQQMHLDIEEMRRAYVEPLSVYVPMDRRHALFHGRPLPEQSTGAALLADISGFTLLTAALTQELGLQRGAEELTRLLNQVYGTLIGEVHHYGGSVLGFSGDAITCWFAELEDLTGLGRPVRSGPDSHPAAWRAVACGLAMQAGMAPFASVSTPTESAFCLAIKVAVVAGGVRRFLVGDPQLQVIEAIAGRTLDHLAVAEHQAQRGELVVQAAIVEQVGAPLRAVEWRTDPDSDQRFAVIAGLDAPVAPLPWPELPPHGLPDGSCRPWLLPAVYRRILSGTKEFLAELRPAVALFVRFTGIDYDRDADAGAKLDAYVRWVQAIIERYEGSIIQLTIGDKGSYLYAAFGAPVAHSDDETRAVRAALALRTPPADLGFISGIQIGLAQGQMRTGAYGSPTQRTYGVLGDKTNLAARLMQAASEGILCDDAVYQGARAHLAFEPLSPIAVKGKAEPIPVYRPVGERQRSPQADAALQACIDRLTPAEQLTLKVASVCGLSFAPDMVCDIHPNAADRAHLSRHWRKLQRLGLIGPDPQAQERYAFASAAVQELAYQGMLFAQRRHLHRLAAEWYERVCTENLAPHLAALAHHWRQAEEPARAVDYMEKAAQQALRDGAYEQAERWLQESLELDAHAAVLSAGYNEQGPVDFEGARQYALARLEAELSPELTYHNLYHTRDDVLPAARRLAALAGIAEDKTRLIETAAVYHDIGFTVQRQEHERLGAEIVDQVLPGFGFSPAQVAAIQGMILATQMPQSPRTPLEEILADADLDVLGREDFVSRNQALRAELATSGTVLSNERWLSIQLQTLTNHRYFTEAARSLRATGKRRNIEVVTRLLAGAAEKEPPGEDA